MTKAELKEQLAQARESLATQTRWYELKHRELEEEIQLEREHACKLLEFIQGTSL